MTGFEDFFRWLADAHGVNVSVAYDAYDRQRFLWGLWTTVWLSLAAGVLSVGIGLAGAAALTGQSRLLRGAVRAYVEAFRNTPPLVQLLFFYLAIGGLLPTVTDRFGAEIFRSGLEAVPAAMLESAESLGYRRGAMLRHVLLPLALRVCLPALGNNLVKLVKTTSLAYAIAVPELLYAASQVWGGSMNVRETMNVLLLAYIVLIAGLVWVLERWERALRLPGWTR